MLDDDHHQHTFSRDLDDSGTSSPASFYRPKSHGNSHLLARLVSREEEIRQVNAALLLATERLDAESSRANAAERRALDYFHRLRIATENRERADHESARLREELKLYKLQLENAQKEIFRAQDIIDQVAAQRNEAEAEAARARTKARKLQEERLVTLAREEGRRAGYREGLRRRIGYGQDDHDDDDFTDEDPSRIHLRSSTPLRQPIRPDSAPPVRTSKFAPPIHSRIHTPSHERRTSSPFHGPNEPDTIHAVPICVSPTSAQHIPFPPDNWIPSPDSRTSHVRVPPPPVPSSPSSAVSDLEDSRPTPQPPEPTPVPPPIRSRDYAYQTSVPIPVPAPVPVQRLPHAPSLASRTSTQISQYDLVNKRPASSLRNEIGRAGGGSLPSRASPSRSERTEAENVIEQWRETATPPRNPPRSSTPSSARRPTQFYYRPRDVVTSTPLGDESRPNRPDSSTPHPPDDPPHARSPFDYLRKRFRQRPSSGGSSSIPNIVVESPSEPETSMSPSATIAAQPELLSPEAANRLLPEDPARQPPPPSQPPPQHDRGRSVTWPDGFVPHRATAPAEDHRWTDSNGYTRPRTQSATSRRMYDVAPVPPGVVYPAPPVRPHTSHLGFRDGERGRTRRDWDRRVPQRGYPERDESESSPAALGRPISLFDSDE